MTDSLKDLLSKKKFDAPDEIAVIKNFVQEKFGEIPTIKLTSSGIIIIVNNASLAGALRYELHNLKSQLKTKKKLFIRIS